MPPPRIPAQTYADSYPFASSYESEKVLQRRQMECEEQRKALMRDERPISPKQRRQKEYEEQTRCPHARAHQRGQRQDR
jgi:hypothetical protein